MSQAASPWSATWKPAADKSVLGSKTGGGEQPCCLSGLFPRAAVTTIPSEGQYGPCWLCNHCRRAATQHSLPSRRYSLLGSDFHRLDHTNLWLAHPFGH